MNITLVNNTCCNISDFDAILNDCVKNKAALPEELADLFTLEIIEVDGALRGILNIA